MIGPQLQDTIKGIPFLPQPAGFVKDPATLHDATHTDEDFDEPALPNNTYSAINVPMNLNGINTLAVSNLMSPMNSVPVESYATLETMSASD